MACALKDADTVARLLYRVGVSEGHANLTRFRDDIAAILEKYLSQTTLQEISAESLMRDLLDLAIRYRIRVPKEYAVLGRASVLVEGTIRKIYPEMNVLEIAGPYARQLLKDRFDTSDLQGTLMRVALRLQGFATEVPMQLSQILIDLESGKLTVSVKSQALDRVAANVKGLGVTIYLGLLSSAFIIGAFIALARAPWEIRGVPAAGVVGVVLFGGTLGAALSWVALSGRGSKIRLSRWLRK